MFAGQLSIPALAHRVQGFAGVPYDVDLVEQDAGKEHRASHPVSVGNGTRGQADRRREPQRRPEAEADGGLTARQPGRPPGRGGYGTTTVRATLPLPAAHSACSKASLIFSSGNRPPTSFWNGYFVRVRLTHSRARGMTQRS